MTNKKTKQEKLDYNEYIRLKHEYEAIESDYADWIDRHNGAYDGDYWD